jgi:hypothetical protein
VLSGAGRLARSLAAMDRRGPLVPASLGALDAVSLAAATPGNRDAALGELEARFASRYQRTPASLAEWQEVARLRGGCGAELQMQIAEDQIDEVAALARRCDDAAAAADALRALGFHDEAHARHAPGARSGSLTELEMVVAAGRWQDAAARLADWQLRLREIDGKPRPGLACLAQWLRDRAPDPAPPAAARIDDRRAPLCAVIDALSEPREAQARALAAVVATAGPADPDPQAMSMIKALAWAAGAVLDPHDGDDSVEGAYASIPMRAQIALEAPRLDTEPQIAVALLAPGARAARSDAPATRGFVLTHFWSAVHAMLRGDHAAARAEAQAARRGDRSGDPRAGGWQHEAGTLDTLLAMRAGEPLPPDAEHHGSADPEALALRLGEVLSPGRFPLRSEVALPGGGLEELRAAVAGDATRLDDLIATRGLEITSGIGQLFALWPRVTRDRDRLASAIRQIAPADGFAPGPLGRLAYAALHRDLALVISDQAAAAAWQEIVDRDLAVFADRDRLLGSILVKLAHGELR